MEVNKVLFISQEISPYLPETPMAVMSRELPQAVQESGLLQSGRFYPKLLLRPSAPSLHNLR